MIAFGRIEFLERLDFGYDRRVVRFAVIELTNVPKRNRSLLVVVVEYHRSILCAHVLVVLSIQKRRIVEEKKQRDYLIRADYVRIVFDLNYFGMICCTWFYLKKNKFLYL